VVLVINEETSQSEKAGGQAGKRDSGDKECCLNVNTKRTNVILGDENIVVYGRDTITDYIGEFKFNISPLSFFQVNPVQTEVLYRKRWIMRSLQARRLFLIVLRYRHYFAVFVKEGEKDLWC